MERQEGQGSLLLLLFSDVSPRTPQRFYKSTHLDSLQNNGPDSFTGFKGLSAPAPFGPATPELAKRREFNRHHMHSSCSSECFIARRVQFHWNPQNQTTPLNQYGSALWHKPTEEFERYRFLPCPVLRRFTVSARSRDPARSCKPRSSLPLFL